MGFCARCGDLVNGQTSRCRCGGRPRDGSVQVSPGAKEGNKDRWSRTYTSKEKSPSPVPSSRGPRTSSNLPPLGMLNMDFNKDEDVSPPPRTPPPSDALGTSHTNLAALPPVQRSPNRRSFPKPLNHSSRVGPRPTTTSRPSSPLKQAYIPPKHDTPPRSDRQEQSTVATDDDLPSIADEELGDLTNTLGSTIQPKDTLPVQLCAGCETPFETDDVRYPDLDDPRGITGVFYCRQCFKDNGGLKGHCDACGLEVLMGRHDGSSVTVRDKLFHTKCFKCTHCGTKVERNHCCDPAGKPCCEPCLDKVLNASSGPTSPAAPRTRRKSGGGPRESDAGDKLRGSPRGPPRGSTTPGKASNTAPSTPSGGNRPRESMSFLEELKQRQSAGGGAPSPSAIRRETLRSRSKSRDADRQPERDQGQERERERDRERERKREPSRDRERDRDRNRERDREREREREREMEREHEQERDYDQEDDHEDSPVGSPINPDMIRRDTMGPRKHASAIRLRAREREREREQSSSPSPAAGRARDRDGDKPSPRSAMRSASRPRERSTSPPPQRSAKFADGHNPPSSLRRSTSKGALKKKDRSTSPGARRGRNDDDSKKPAPRSALRSASRPRMSDSKPRRERERSKSPPAKDGPLYPVGKLTRDLGSLSVGIASVDDSNVSTSDSHSSIARSDWTAISSTTSGTSLRGSMSPGSVSGSDIKPALKTRRSGMRDSVSVEDSAMSESPSTSSRTRRPLRSSQIGRESFSDTAKAPSESADNFKPAVTEAETEEDFDKSIGGESDFKPSTPSRLARRRSVGRDSPASTGTITPVNRARGGTPSSGRKPAGVGDYHEPEEHRTSWLRNRDSRTRSFIGSARGDYSDTSLDSVPWSRRSTLLDDSSSSRRGSVIEPDTFSPPPAATPVSPPSTSAPAPSKRRVKVDDLVMPIDSTERCSKCNEKLHLDGGNMFVTVPGYAKTGSNGEFTPARTFHVDCFKCSVCELPFGGEAWEGQQARFVQLKDVIAHPECAPPIVRTATYTPSPTKITNRALRTLPQPPEPSLRSAPVMPRPISSATLPTPAASAPPVRPRSGTTGQAPRFGGSMYCPACNKSVSPMEMGTCPGPNGSRWHSSCLVCGGKDAKKNRKNPKDPGCGKQLDSGAKYDQDGGVWCRECIDKLPFDMRPSSPTKQLVPTHTGNRSLGRSGGAIVAQYTGVSVHTTGGGILRPQTTGGGGGILKPQTTGGGGILKPQTTGGGGILKPQTTGGGGFIRPQVTGGRSAGAIPTQYTGGSIVGGLVPQLTGGVPITMQLTGGQYRRAAAKSVGNFAELEEQVTGSGRPRPVSVIGQVDFHTAMSLARRGVSMDDTDDEPPVRERPKSAYGLRSWKI